MSVFFGKEGDKIKDLKELIRKIHEGSEPESVKEEFKEMLKSVSTEEISRAEKELVEEGMPVEDIHKLCEVHLALLKDSQEEEKALAPEGHPIHTLMEEHKMLLEFSNELRSIAWEIKKTADFNIAEVEMEKIKRIKEDLMDSESHYLREENVIFPYLQKHGVTQPPTIMWMEHDKIREIKKNLYKIIDEQESSESKDFAEQLSDTTVALDDMLSNHFLKENSILFPLRQEISRKTRLKRFLIHCLWRLLLLTRMILCGTSIKKKR